MKTGEKADRKEDSEKAGKGRKREEDWKERKKGGREKGRKGNYWVHLPSESILDT